MRSVRPQRSLASLPSSSSATRERSRPPPLPTSPRLGRSSDYDGRPRSGDRSYRPSLDSSSSAGSGSSAGSSFLDRMRSSNSTPRTSMDEEDYAPKASSARRRQPLAERRQNRSRRQYEDDDPDSRVQDDDAEHTETGATSSFWSYFSSAAGSLTVNVSKAWAANIAYAAGEETPPGQESRLTKAMKAYHLEKARDPSDLPEWLFDESERFPGRRSRREPVERERRYAAAAEETPEPPRGRGFRDIYDAAAGSSSRPAPRARSTARGYDAAPSRPREYSPAPSRSSDAYAEETGGAGSKASNRLKAMRDAKRQAAARNAGSPLATRDDDDMVSVRSGRSGMDDVGGASAASGRSVPAARPRVGLPSGPGMRPRRV
ncbi:hypothetical protein PUNSTDRAFT_53731 [Punctularia strigosozonata HHB-11173 SS5]|uniref:uncharacterized protein n=1 Tax=Punctularia strigosozonata (strain HHB-11173) TaxID=741275 RepID=UPI0004416874|nr:uncharacterized protein PUNSTDRAFT_53731 [Punctularia strigosozonata HHB-11173 SS5]EIN07399.1 hypothetical protein PUNSTDRAFT_53731 [Punctularia strigosozonata HHB-11173 SS5]